MIGPVAFNIMVMSTDVSTVAAMAELTDGGVQNCAIFAENGKKKLKSCSACTCSSSIVNYVPDHLKQLYRLDIID